MKAAYALPLLAALAQPTVARTTHRSVIQSAVSSVDPLLAVDTNSQLIVTNAFDGLVQWTADAGIAPAIASSWSFSADKLNVSFLLRKGVRFQDGSALTAEDVARHFKRIAAGSYYAPHFSNVQSVDAPSTDQVVFKLKTSSPYFLQLLGGAAGRIVKITRSGEVVGSGPFRPSLSPDGLHVTLTRFPEYWGPTPTIETLEFKRVDEALATKLARDELVDDVALFGLKDAAYNDLPSGQQLRQPLWATWAIGFDQRVRPLDNATLRRALARQLPSVDWVREIYPEQMPAHSLLPFGMPGYIGDSASTPPLAPNSPTPCPPKSQCHVTIDVPDTLESRGQIATWIKTRTSGIPNLVIDVRFTPFSDMMGRYARGVMGAYLVSLNAEYPDPSFLLRALHSGSRSNYLGIRSKQVDMWIDKADNEPDPAKRAAIFREFNIYLMQEAALVPLMHATHRTWTRACVSGLQLSPVGEGYFNYRGVRNSCR